MKKMKGSNSYLKNQVRKNIAKVVLCLALFCLILGIVTLRATSSLRLDVLDEAGLLLSLVPLAALYFYLHRYRIYSGGWAGEKQVTKLLGNKLSDDYILINDLYLQNGAGDIDHVVLGPGGIFVLETKNWSGHITCNGDDWQRAGKGNFKGSPSRQVKRNVATIKRVIDSSPALRPLSVWVEGVVVFTNRHATLHLNNPTVLILKLPQLPKHITQESSSKCSSQQIEAIAKEIIRRKR